jgi:hypothetical protein
MKTSLDVIEQAFRRLGIKAEDEALTADQMAYANQTLEALMVELREHMPLDGWPDAIPDRAFVPLSNMLASEIGPSYSVPSEARTVAYVRLMAVMRPDDREQSEAVYY